MSLSLSELRARILNSCESPAYIPCVYFGVSEKRLGLCPRTCPAYGSPDCTPAMMRDIARKIEFSVID
jgi:hypothetical protein